MNNTQNEWICFNREYMPLGWNKKNSVNINDDDAFGEYPIYTAYNGVTTAILTKLAIEPTALRKDEDEKIYMVFLYNDGTNPQSSPKHWNAYFDKIKLLAKCEVKRATTP